MFFQYFRLRPINANVEVLARELVRRFPGTEVVAFATPEVAFFLVVRDEHRWLVERSGAIGATWRGQIEVISWRRGRAPLGADDTV